MHVRATNADRKSIKRLLHPRHSAAAPPHGNQPLSSLFIPSRFTFLSFLVPSIPLAPPDPPALQRTRPPSPREKRFLSSGPVNLKTILRRCTLLSGGVPFSKDIVTENISSPAASIYFSFCLLDSFDFRSFLFSLSFLLENCSEHCVSSIQTQKMHRENSVERDADTNLTIYLPETY